MHQEEKNDESLLWDEFRNGSKQAFSSIYFAHYSNLYHYGLKILRERETVKDVIHELFLRLWSQREKLTEVRSIRFYLLKALKRDLVHKISRGQRHFFLSGDPDFVDIDFSPEDLILQDEADDAQRQLFVRLLNALPKRQREVLYLRYYENLSHEEIAEMMGMNYQSVSNLIHRALKNLRDHIKMLFIASLVQFSYG